MLMSELCAQVDCTALEYRQGTYGEPHNKSRDTVHVIQSTLCLPSPMIAPNDYMVHLKSLDKFHRALQHSPLLSLHRMGLPSSDSVAETFLQLSTLPLAIDSSQHCAVIPPMTYEFRFTLVSRLTPRLWYPLSNLSTLIQHRDHACLRYCSLEEVLTFIKQSLTAKPHLHESTD